MRDINFIHAEEDRVALLTLAADLGMTLRYDYPSPEPRQTIVDAHEFAAIKSGVFIGYLPEWVFGEFQFCQIDGGYNEGKYFQNPSTNYAGIQFYFFGERRDGDFVRLGSGFISRDIEWYRPADHTVHPAPAEIKEVFDKIFKTIDKKKYLVVGGRRYFILKEAMNKLMSGQYRSSFDFMDNVEIHQ